MVSIDSLSKILYFAESKVSLRFSGIETADRPLDRPRDVLITHRERPRATLRSILCKSSSESTSFTRSEKGVRRYVSCISGDTFLLPLFSHGFHHLPPPRCTVLLFVPFPVSRAHGGRLTSMGRHAHRFSV